MILLVSVLLSIPVERSLVSQCGIFLEHFQDLFEVQRFANNLGGIYFGTLGQDTTFIGY